MRNDIDKDGALDSVIELREVSIDDFTFEQRPVSELPESNVSQWLADFNGDDQWCDEGHHVSKAAVVLGNHIIVWQDGPLTDADKEDAVAEYERPLAFEEEEAREMELEDEELVGGDDWANEGF